MDVSALVRQAERECAAGRFGPAEDLLSRALRSRPDHLHALAVLGLLHQARGEFEAMEGVARRAMEAWPDRSTGRVLLAEALTPRGRLEEAAAALGPITRGPGALPLACCKLADVLTRLGRFSEALARCAEWIERWPEDAVVRFPLCDTLSRMGEGPGLVGALREGVARFPGHQPLRRWMASAALYEETPDGDLLALARSHAALIERGVSPAALRRRARTGPIRVGFLSGDLRTHSVTYFLRPLLEGLDRSRFWCSCYHTGGREDAVSERLRGLVACWRRCERLGDEQLAAAIRADGLDVLVDLAGVGTGSRPGVIARRCAPVQATFLGYPGTTGLGAMDVRIVDSTTDPLHSESSCSERLSRLDPCFLCYRPWEDLPPPGRAGGREPVTFGSFNSPLKVSGRTVALWSGVLSAVPKSRLLLKGSGQEFAEARERLVSAFEAKGVERSRLEMVGQTPGVREHLEHYGRVDVALDTYPYQGTTTTCEALVMGVPVVVRVGDSHRSRVGLSILKAVGQAGFAAESDVGYIETARSLANDADLRQRLRSEGPDGLRAGVLGSALCDAGAYARRFESLLGSLVDGDPGTGTLSAPGSEVR
ncbi:hypothetical protein PHYC_01782 [Phycisphaerales bacterium]|nr:hypothetical protein PHYC_01782 [Phycisphaerales bacterium]